MASEETATNHFSFMILCWLVNIFFNYVVLKYFGWISVKWTNHAVPARSSVTRQCLYCPHAVNIRLYYI